MPALTRKSKRQLEDSEEEDESDGEPVMGILEQRAARRQAQQVRLTIAICLSYLHGLSPLPTILVPVTRIIQPQVVHQRHLLHRRLHRHRGATPLVLHADQTHHHRPAHHRQKAFAILHAP